MDMKGFANESNPFIMLKHTGHNIGPEDRFGKIPARPGGLEPPTSGFGDLRSTN
jgi:hypothetical protein